MPAPRTSRRNQLHVPAVVLQARAKAPLRRQICAQIARAIRDGKISPGMRLPSSRLLARLLGVSRNTVLAAYDELADAGLIAGQPGAGVRVLSQPGAPGGPGVSLRQLLRDAAFPDRTLDFADPDGNRLYLRW